MESLGDVLTFMRLLWAVDHQLRSASKRMLAAAGVTGPQRLVLRMVGRFPSTSAGDLAALLHIHPSTLTGVFDRLEQRGLLERLEDPEDGRRALFRLSARGEAVNGLRAGTVEDAVRRTLSKLPRAKVAAASDVLVELSEGLEACGREPRSVAKKKVKRKKR